MKKIITLTICCLLSGLGFSQNTALHFDSLNSYVQTNYPGLSGGSQARTIEAWIRTTSNFNPSAGGKQGVIADYGTFVTGGRFTFNVLWSNAIRLEVGGNGLSGSIAINDGNWHHVAVVYNPAATNKYSLYVDSVLDISGNLTVTTNTGSGIDLRIGRRIDGVNNFRGEIDEVRFFNHARTQAQIGGERNDEYCSLPVGLTAYYKFNEGTANVSNAGKDTAINYAGTQNGLLTNFLLTGATRNYVAGPPLTPGLTKSIVAATACGSYTTPSGKIFTTSGIYFDTLTNSVSCDSLMSYNITFSPAIIRNTVSDTGCGTYTTPLGQLISSTGTYYDTLPTTGGCDTTIRYNIVISGSVNDSVFRTGATITSWDTWAAHQWVRCDSNFKPIAGETSRLINITEAGDYAVIVTRGSCVDTSECITISLTTIDELSNQVISVYPNPTKDIIYIISDKNITNGVISIYSVNGKKVIEQNYDASQIEVSSLANGVYYLQLNSEGKTYISKFVKQ